MIRTEAVTKRFGAVLAVDGIDLDVREGDRYGLLGPNGSGKTTLVRLLLGLVFATSGRIEVLGRPVPRRVKDVLPEVGALVEGPAGYPHLSGRTNLRLFDTAGPSLGMRQRLGLAAALLRTPKLLILDEPTNGLDPRGMREIRDLLAELNAAGTTVFLSSHLLFEVEQLCTRVGIVDRGKLVLQDELATLQAPTGRVLVSSPDAGRAAALLDGRVERHDGDRLTVRHTDSAELNELLVREGLRVAEIGPERRSLEQVVLDVTTTSSDRHD